MAFMISNHFALICRKSQLYTLQLIIQIHLRSQIPRTKSRCSIFPCIRILPFRFCTPRTTQAQESGQAVVGTDATQSSSASLDSVPAYSGQPYVTLNNNVPDFTDADMQTTSYEEYSDLDNLGRCGAANAIVGIDLMPTEPRGAIERCIQGRAGICWQRSSYGCPRNRSAYFWFTG